MRKDHIKITGDTHPTPPKKIFDFAISEFAGMLCPNVALGGAILTAGTIGVILAKKKKKEEETRDAAFQEEVS